MGEEEVLARTVEEKRSVNNLLQRSRFKQLLFACILLVLVGYTLSAYLYASMIIEYNGGFWWRSSSQGSLFPIPHGPGMLTALSPVSDLDAFIYRNLLRIPLLIVVDAVVIALRWFEFVKQLSKIKMI